MDAEAKQKAFEAWAGQQDPSYVLHKRPIEQRRGAANIYSNQRTQHAFEGFAGACNSHEQLMDFVRDITLLGHSDAGSRNPLCQGGTTNLSVLNAIENRARELLDNLAAAGAQP